jgi:tryptophan-rich sensory protein
MIWMFFAIFLCACAAAGVTGGVFPPGQWYRDLEKPSWTPPDWLFPVAWSLLYLCMAAAAARAAVLPASSLALALWALQIAFNTLWTPIFFGLQRIKGGLIVLTALWLSVAACMIALFQLDTVAGLLFVPYLIWVSIAGALNIQVMRLNPGQ